MNDASLDIAVIGAGPVGLALGLQAARSLPRARITVFDARPIEHDVSADPRTLALSLGSVQLLQRLGAWDARAAQPILEVHVSQQPPFLPSLPLPLLPRRWQVEPELRIRAFEEAVPMLGAVLGYGRLVAPLQAAWMAAAAAEPQRLASRFGTAVVACKNLDGAVEVDAGIAERFDVAIVAEGGVFSPVAEGGMFSPVAEGGVFSPVAEGGVFSPSARSDVPAPVAERGGGDPGAAGGTFEHARDGGGADAATDRSPTRTPGTATAPSRRPRIRRDYRQTAWVGRVGFEPGRAPPAGTAFERFTRHGPAALLPLGGLEAALVWCVASDDDPVRGLDAAQRVAVLNTVFHAAVGRIASVTRLKAFALGLNAERTLTDGRTVRIGNAAQMLHPVAGQGLNLGLRDAFDLVRALARVERRSDVDAALRRLEWQRGPDRWAMIAATDFLARSFTWSLPGAGAARGAGLAALQALAPVKSLLARQMMFGRR